MSEMLMLCYKCAGLPKSMIMLALENLKLKPRHCVRLAGRGAEPQSGRSA
jgi:hypothetical protein